MKIVLKIALLVSLMFTQNVLAKSASEIDREVDIAIEEFKKEIEGGAKFLPRVKGYLVFPSVKKAGFILAGEYGEGALRVNGRTQAYYSMASASVGIQAGAQEHSVVIAFISEGSMKAFTQSDGWEAGADGSIVVNDWSENKDITSMSYEKPIIAFIYGAKGYLASASLEATKFEKLNK